MASKERENFYKYSTLIVDHAKDSLVDVLELHLALKSLSFEDFINLHQHDIYHLCFNKRRCCQCPHGYVLPHNCVLYPSQLEILLDKYGVPRSCHVPGGRADFCCCLAKPGVTTNVLDITLARCLLINFCNDVFRKNSLRKNIDTLLQMRNNVYGHAKEGRISDINYEIYKNEIESAILEIAKVCGNDTEKKQTLMDLEKRPLDETLCIQYQTALLEWIARDTEARERWFEQNFDGFLGTVKKAKMLEGSLLPQDHSSMLKRLLGDGSYESFQMRVMVTGQFGVGKTSLVMILVGDEAPHEAQSTDGISLLEGRCGLDIENRDWILIAKDDYNDHDVVYQKVLMTSDKPTETEDATSKRHHPEQAIPKEIDTKLPTWPETTEAAKIDQKIESKEAVKLKSKMTRKEIKKQMKKALERGDYKMKVGRLLFWDFGGQYVFYTTHQSFMTYRALFLVVFDGSTNLYDEVPGMLCFPGQHGTTTAAVFLQHWVNSILTYCKVISGEILIPQILFVATHKDKISEKDVEKRRTSIYNEIEQLFKHHEGCNHLVMKHRVFVNAMNRNDPEIEILKKIITELTFNHPCWGEKMPNAWVPLELEIAELKAEGRQIVSLKEIEELNNASEVSTLSAEDLKTFLQIQHSLGNIVYFDNPQLKDYVVISTLYMIEVMKSFVTDRQFWPEDSKAKETFNKMSVHGVIQKSDLFSLWERKEFSKILLYKEYVFDMLVHLDILSEQRRYDRKTGSRLPVEDFFVPCMVTEQYTTNYMKNECTPQRAICLAFVFKGSIIPPALPNRLIGACLSMWHLKTYEGKKLLFSGFIGLTFDKSHDIIVRVESNKILLFILHKTSKELIVHDIATGVKECLYATLERISEFYQLASNKNLSQQQPFHVELACSNFKCFLPETEAKASENNHVICEGCKQNYEIENWNQDKTKGNCHHNCTGLSEEALVQHPSDRELCRFSSPFTAVEMHDLVIHLGLNETDWENMRDDHPRNIEVVKLLILIKWREQNTGIFRDLAEALTEMDVTKHMLCQVRRGKRYKNRDFMAEHKDYIPTDEILDALAPEIGIISFHLGIELGLRVIDVQRIQYRYQDDIVKQITQILYEWRNDTTVKATLGVLEQALVDVGRGAMCLKTVVDTIGVDKRHNSRQQSI